MRLDTTVTGLILLTMLSACDPPSPEPPPTSIISPKPPAGIAASYTDGQLSLDEVESEFATTRTPACAKAQSAPGGGSTETLIPCYRELAEALAIEDIVLGGLSDMNQALQDLDDNYVEQRNAALLRAYYRRILEQIEVDDDEIEAMLASGETAPGTVRRFSLHNIFRRHRDPAKPEQTVEFLIQLRARINAGETFGSIARAYSDSETRLNDGMVGNLAEDKLPQRLREETAKLESGEVSKPLLVKGGAVLLKIENITPAVVPDQETNRLFIRARIAESKTEHLVEKRTSVQAVPDSAILLSPSQLVKKLDAGIPDLLIFDLGGQQLTVTEFRNLTGLDTTGSVIDLPQDRRDRIQEAYLRLRQERLLIMSLLESGNVADIELRSQIEKPLQKERLTRLVDQQLQDDMWRSIDEQPAALERYFNDNKHHYQTPLKVKLQILHLPFDHNPAAQLEKLEQLHDSLAEGNDSLAEAAVRLGGTVEDSGWQAFSELDYLPKKARSYLLQATPGGYSIPYQQDDALHLIWIESQQLPEQLNYEDVVVRVRKDYLERFERRLYQQAVKQSLVAANFEFYTENVRELFLAPGGNRDLLDVADTP